MSSDSSDSSKSSDSSDSRKSRDSSVSSKSSDSSDSSRSSDSSESSESSEPSESSESSKASASVGRLSSYLLCQPLKEISKLFLPKNDQENKLKYQDCFELFSPKTTKTEKSLSTQPVPILQ